MVVVVAGMLRKMGLNYSPPTLLRAKMMAIHHTLQLLTITYCTTRETVTTATEIQPKTVERLCGFGRVVGIIL